MELTDSEFISFDLGEDATSKIEELWDKLFGKKCVQRLRFFEHLFIKMVSAVFECLHIFQSQRNHSIFLPLNLFIFENK